ncbi:hypothetical protein [Helicobacter suis]|nr:hypothetical protein [Helicobacter suis]
MHPYIEFDRVKSKQDLGLNKFAKAYNVKFSVIRYSIDKRSLKVLAI